MKVTHRIPTKEPYAYVEVEYELDNELSKGIDAFLVSENQKDLTKAITGEATEGLPPQEWRDLLDHYLSGKPFVGDEVMKQIEQMSAEQKFCMSEIKKSRARTKEKPELQDRTKN